VEKIFTPCGRRKNPNAVHAKAEGKTPGQLPVEKIPIPAREERKATTAGERWCLDQEPFAQGGGEGNGGCGAEKPFS